MKKNKSILLNSDDLNKIENTIYFARLSTLIQGILFIEHFSNKENLEIKIPEVLQNWLSGCIIRSDLLKDIKEIYESNFLKDKNSKASFNYDKKIVSSFISDLIKYHFPDLKSFNVAREVFK